MFTHYLIFLLQKLGFLKVLLLRFIIILFRKRKKIELLFLKYDSDNIFDNSYIVINYRFRNVLYYRFDNHITLEKQLKIFDLKNFKYELDLTVYGFFQKKKYHLKFNPQLTINTEDFKTSFSNLSLELIDQSIPKLAKSIKILNINNTTVNSPNINITTNRLNITHKNFNQNEFI